MDKVIEFLKDKRVCVLATVAEDGTPQTAVVHFSHQEKPLKFFFFTNKSSRKAKNAVKNSQASVVVGWDEAEFTTVQMDGEVHVLQGEDLTKMQSLHFAKFPSREKFKDDADSEFLEFTPKWIRYSSLKTKTVEEINIPD